MVDLGEVEDGWRHLSRGLEVWKNIQSPWGELGVKRGAAECLEGLADIEMRRLHRNRGLALLGAARSVRENCGAATPPAVRGGFECRLHQWPARVEGDGQTYTIDEAVGLGLS